MEKRRLSNLKLLLMVGVIVYFSISLYGQIRDNADLMSIHFFLAVGMVLYFSIAVYGQLRK